MNKSVVACVAEHARNTPDKIAIRTVDSEISFYDLYHIVRQYAAFLRENGVLQGDIVVTKAANTIEYAVLYLGVHLAGGTICSLEKSTPCDVILAIADQLRAQIIIDSELAQESDHNCENDGKNGRRGEQEHRILTRDVFVQVMNSVEELEGERFPDADDSADILFTTGTTGTSKGVELSHGALIATAENLIHGCGYETDLLLVAPGPLNHANAIRKLFTSLVNGNTIFLLNGLTNLNNFFLALDEAEGNAACCLPPAMIRLLLTLAKDKLGEYADSIRFIESASAPLPESDRERLIQVLPKTRLIINYGSSESASVTMYDCNAHPGRVNCIGKPMPNAEVFIVDDNHKVIQSSKDRLGLIACKGKMNMKGYINAPKLTQSVLQDGIVYTNDIGYIDDEGYVYILSRRGDVINVGGFKVNPLEVEDAALSYDQIKDCICISEKDRISGQAPRLLYVSSEEIDLRKLREYLASHLEGYKCPKHYERVEHVERTYNGKLNRKYYRENPVR